jgi:serine/threonine protein kinase
VVGELDDGGQATVYRVVHPGTGQDLALKLAKKRVALGETDLDLSSSEARILGDLDHPGLVRVVDLDIHDGRMFLAMEYVRGRSLQQYVKDRPVDTREAARLVIQVASAAEAVHRRGIVHQDIKPKNILVHESGRARLIDFGMARWRHAWSLTEDGPSGGTPEFMAPEQAQGQEDRIGPRTDVFALGAVLYSLLTGHAPFRSRKAAPGSGSGSPQRLRPRRPQESGRSPPAGAACAQGNGHRARRSPRVGGSPGPGPQGLPPPAGGGCLISRALEARVNRPAYLYLVWIDVDGVADPVYPWKPGDWSKVAVDEQPVTHLAFPTAESKGWEIKKSRSGMETLVLLARESPLDADLKSQFTGLPRTALQDTRSLVWFDAWALVRTGAPSEPATPSRDRGPSFFEVDIKDPVLQTQDLLKDRLKAQFSMMRAVSFANQGG